MLILFYHQALKVGSLIQTEKLTSITPTFREGDDINQTFNVGFSSAISVRQQTVKLGQKRKTFRGNQRF